MSGSLRRITAIVQADFRVRFRRVSTLIVFLLLSAFAYVWVPAPSTGRALIQLNGHRAIYNSGAIGMGTASIAMMFVGLFGFYVISNAIRRDILTRCGLIIASTPMRTMEYLLGKFIGNVVFLATFTAGFMLSSMAMLALRAEAPLQPLVFVRQYLLLTSASIAFVSAVAVFFESSRWLSGKLGDVVYFFVWLFTLGLVVAQETTHAGINWGRCFDFTGFGFMISESRRVLGIDDISIGSSAFDPMKAPIDFPGLSLTSDWLVPRLVSILLPLAFLPVIALFFHRFDPARTRPASDKGKRNWIGRIQMLFKPLSRRIAAILTWPARGGSFFSATWTDAILTFTLFPLVLVVFVAITITSICPPAPAATLPVVFAVLAIILSDLATRDARSGTTASIYSVPRLREWFVPWKFFSAFVLGLTLCAGPILRTATHGAGPIFALVGGIFFVAAVATALGVITKNPKTFIVAFLTFGYVVVNDHGLTPLMDFAGFYGAGSLRAIVLYAAIGTVSLVAAQVFHQARLRRA